MSGFSGLTVLMLATNERSLFRETLHAVIDVCGASDLYEIVVVLLSAHCPAAEVCAEYGDRLRGVRLRTYIQKNRDKILFFSEVPFLAKSSHFVIMGSDMEMSPYSLADMLKIVKKNPETIVCASKWSAGSDVVGYGCFHRISNIMVNQAAARIIGKRYRDLFSIFQIYPKSVFDRMRFGNMKTLLFEYTLKPVACGEEYVEIPTIYRKRTENRANTNLPLFIKLGVLFLFTAVEIRISQRNGTNSGK